MELELTRLLSAWAVGCGLSFAGSLTQLTSRNELASPSTLGMDGLAVLMVIIAYLLKNFLHLDIDWETLSFVLGLSFLALFWWSSRFFLNLQDFKIVLLMGLGINLLIGAVFSTLQFLMMAYNQKFPTELWFGRIHQLSQESFLSLLLIIVLVIFFTQSYRRQWKVLLLDLGWCYALGVPVQNMIRFSLLLSFLITLWVVSYFGVFGFLGLLFPLLLRQIPRYQARPWREMTEGALGAGLIFAILDQICFHWTFQGAEIPVGLPVMIFGASALVLLLWQRSRSE